MLMQTINHPEIMDCLWKEVRDECETLNPSLAEILDACVPTGKEIFSLVQFPYGYNIIEDGELTLQHPSDPHRQFPEQASQFCAMVLTGSVECHHLFSDRIAPMHCHTPGEIVGLETHQTYSRHYGIPESFQMTAGARSIFMLPKITDSASHKNIQREFNIRASTPKKLIQHWEIFRQLAQHPDVASTWKTTLLIFPIQCLDPNNKQYHPLQHFFAMQTHQRLEYWRHQYLWDLTFSRIKAHRNLKPNPYLADTCKHLFAIGVGAVPGFTAAHNDLLAPVSQLQKIYLEVYGLKHYAPVFMQPLTYNYRQPCSPVYYSLQLPTLLEFSPKSRNLSSTISDLREVKHITATYLSELVKGELGIENTPIVDFALNAEFAFYHSEEDMYGEINYSQDLLAHDEQLHIAHARFDEQGFSENSPFVRGCVRIHSKNNKAGDVTSDN